MKSAQKNQSPLLHREDTQERDACALICAVRKGGQATHGNVKRTIEALARMGHRTGMVDGEGDGVGIMTDIPRQLWAATLALKGMRSSLATDQGFWVAHLMIPNPQRGQTNPLIDAICNRITEAGLQILIDQPGKTDPRVLGPNAAKNEPGFWQIAGINGRISLAHLEREIFRIQAHIEREFGVHFPSFSSRSVVYKVQGTVEILRRYYPELRDPDYASVVTLGHARYSTNTNPIFERVQPFNVLGHNGEFNTVSRFRLEAQMLNIWLDPNNSDSQDIDRVIDALTLEQGLDLIETMEHVFPPFEHDLIQSSTEIHDLYKRIRQAFGPFAQGPAAVAARSGDQCVFSVDALGLRPLWFGETEKEYFASSERGVYPLDMMSAEPKPLAPGEKIALIIKPGRSIEVLDYPSIQRHVLNRYRERGDQFELIPPTFSTRAFPTLPSYPRSSNGNGSQPALVTTLEALAEAEPIQLHSYETKLQPAAVLQLSPLPNITAGNMAALGWERYHTTIVEAMAETNKELIGSLGWDGPLAALSKTRVNIADYFKETVAVVTNPAIDRERERAQFSTEVYVGVRPEIGTPLESSSLALTLTKPLLLTTLADVDQPALLREVAESQQTWVLEDLIEHFEDRAYVIDVFAANETLPEAIERIVDEAIHAVQNGAECLVLDDAVSLAGSSLWIDPLLVVSAVDRGLRDFETEYNLRRRCGIILRSGAMRDLHDVILALGLGATAVAPYALYTVALGLAPRPPRQPLTPDEIRTRLSYTVNALTTGIQKVTSTIGCHELRGYGHSFSTIGLSQDVASIFDTANYFGSHEVGATWDVLQTEAEARAAEFRGEVNAKLENPDRLYPKMWKKIEDIALGELSLDDYTEQMLKIEQEMPVALRHLLGFKPVESSVNAEDVHIGIGQHDLPFVIGAMSYGSQGELSYKSYAEAAYRLNMICINGEGGELPEVMGKYPNNRGNQIASARFGVNIEFLNSCHYLEIKVGQGAKPGEGGHLPGFKVIEKVAIARGTLPGVDLISPSNNHDLYSIEDLAQLIDELKTANPNAKISVKIPVGPGVGIISVGVAKAGADIINITGYDGGTGAARAHSLRHVGLPAEIGLWLAHRELIESGLRDDVELWVDGGMKSGRDVIKMICLGANRVGFGTLAMVAVGCTICRKCQDGTCHVGITTHMITKEEALAKGIKHFEPRDFDLAVQGIVNVFNMLGEDVRRWTAALGETQTQNLVGRADLLEQLYLQDRIDLTPLLQQVPRSEKRELQKGIGYRLARPRNTLSKQITSLIAEHVSYGNFELTYDDEQVMAMDRALGTHLSGALKRGEIPHADQVKGVHLNFSNSAVPGNGLGAFIDSPVDITVEGGAQDGVAKCARGGTISILKGLNHNGKRLDGSVGKSFAYGAQGGTFIVQGNADTRACIRLSGADVIFGGEVTQPLRDDLGALGTRANLKGYACEYMTSGRVLVLGDPGPWMCAGMSGGVIYQRIQPEMNLTVDAIRRRIAQGASVNIFQLDEHGVEDIRSLLGLYISVLEQNNQGEEVAHLHRLLMRPHQNFVQICIPPKSVAV